ncbi:MAG: hypothetical protein IVW57_13010 [Ktedonobacterales bacterium]|nr:hypothetical protein [Ktedonobacterales bacterium]
MERSINDYLARLARQLVVERAERAEILEEVRAHLEEHAASLTAHGRARALAEREAVAAFGRPGPLSRQLVVTHARSWTVRRFVAGMLQGGASAWAIWILGTVLVSEAYTRLVTSPGGTPAPLPFPDALTQSTPLSQGAFYAFYSSGWLWLLPLVALFLVPPFLWGRRAWHWWAPGLAYGLGAWLAIPWFILPVLDATPDWGWQAQAHMVLAALPLALLASGAGYLWQRRGVLFARAREQHVRVGA